MLYVLYSYNKNGIYIVYSIYIYNKYSIGILYCYNNII